MSCKRKGVLQLTLDDYHRYADLVEDGLVRAAKFLTRERVFDAGTLPCATQLIPLPTICAVLGDDFEKDAVREKLARIDPYVLPKVAERLHLLLPSTQEPHCERSSQSTLPRPSMQVQHLVRSPDGCASGCRRSRR